MNFDNDTLLSEALHKLKSDLALQRRKSRRSAKKHKDLPRTESLKLIIESLCGEDGSSDRYAVYTFFEENLSEEEIYECLLCMYGLSLPDDRIELRRQAKKGLSQRDKVMNVIFEKYPVIREMFILLIERSEAKHRMKPTDYDGVIKGLYRAANPLINVYEHVEISKGKTGAPAKREWRDPLIFKLYGILWAKVGHDKSCEAIQKVHEGILGKAIGEKAILTIIDNQTMLQEKKS